LKKFIPPDKLWPINETWYFHAGANEGNNTLDNITRVLEKRYGPSRNVEEFSKKAQLAHYEDVRAQYESYATHWNNRKMVVHWMMNNPWPSVFGHLFDAYFKPGGGYFGAKKALRPISVVWDYYASGDRSIAKVYVANHTGEDRKGLKVSVAFYNLDGARKFYREVKDLSIGPNSSMEAMTVKRVSSLDSTYLVRCELRNASGALLAENVYWQSAGDDDLGEAKNDEQFKTNLAKWADMSVLNTMPRAEVKVSGNFVVANGHGVAKIRLTNDSNRVAFFLRAEITKGMDGDEILPITYDDNYITIFPHEMRTIEGHFRFSEQGTWSPGLRLEGYNVSKNVLSLEKK
jgi:exo-1,4-beta-D-glucosaminidase